MVALARAAGKHSLARTNPEDTRAFDKE